MKWLSAYLQRHRLYTPQSICSDEHSTTSCYTAASTWETFLTDSLHLFATLSVRINAIIPPRATELRFLSTTDPYEIRFGNASRIKVPIIVEVDDEEGSLVTHQTDDQIEALKLGNADGAYSGNINNIFDGNKRSMQVMGQERNLMDYTAAFEVVEYYSNIMVCMEGKSIGFTFSNVFKDFLFFLR